MWTIMSLFHLMCTTGLSRNMAFGDGLLYLRKAVLKERIAFIYQCAQNKVPIEDIYAICVRNVTVENTYQVHY